MVLLKLNYLDTFKMRKRYSLSDLISYAVSKNGVCLSNSYRSSNDEYVWMCNICGHKWKSTWGNMIHRESWCAKCAGKLKLSLDDARIVALNRNGICLSNKYLGCDIPLMWECNKGHVWSATLNKVKNYLTWCPCCHSSIGEKITREYFNRIFKVKFTKCRPLWLVTDDGRRLELDGYNDELKIAFEYNGLQHRKEIKLYNSRRSFSDQIYCDNVKINLCNVNGVKLFRIDDNIKYNNISSVIFNQAVDFGIVLDSSVLSFDYKQFNIFNTDLSDTRDLVMSRGGMLISDMYIISSSKLDIICGEGHKFSMSRDKLKRGQWCPFCAGKYVDIDKLHKHAILYGGCLLSDKWLNSCYKYEWKCSKGHVWRATWGNIQQGRWCPRCKGERLWNTRRLNMRLKTTSI